MNIWNKNKNNWFVLLILLIVGLLAIFFVYPPTWNKTLGSIGLPSFYNRPFHLGLDLQGGTHLVYEADLSTVAANEQNEAMQGVRNVIERRINLFGVQEPVIQINKAGSRYRLIVELAGIKDVGQAIEMIGQTPTLDFREERSPAETENILNKQKEIRDLALAGSQLTPEQIAPMMENPYFQSTALTGRYLKGSELHFSSQTYQSEIGLKFNDEGKDIFKDLTQRNVGKKLAIFLDGVPISAPVVQETIPSGEAQITGNFTVDEAKDMVRRLNAGALPVPIKLISQQTIGASLGKTTLDRSLQAGIIGFIAVLIYMLLVYRLPGLFADIALLFYVAVILSIFKLIPVTLTLTGIAGFILSIGMAVDNDVLIFERFKEALKEGKSFGGSVGDGFQGAWPAIRDSNLSVVLTCVILHIFTTGTVQGFALTLGLGVIVNTISVIIVTKCIFKMFVGTRLENYKKIWK